MNSLPRTAHSVSDATPAEEIGALESVAVLFLLGFIFLSYSRIVDVFLAGLRLSLITSVVALIFTALTGGVGRALFSRAGFWLVAFTLWLIAAVPFSSWPGGSVQLLLDYWIKSFLVFVIVAGSLRTVRHCRLALCAIGLAVVAIVIMALSLGTDDLSGRLQLEQGVLANPNDLAQLLLIGSPGLWLLGTAKPGFSLRRVAVVVACVGVLRAVTQTGSRGAIVVLFVLICVLLLKSAWSTRVKLIGGLLLASLLLVPFLSDEQWYRYSTILSDAPAGSDEALGSKEARIELLKQSIYLTMANPVFGVGPGVFESASAGYSESQGERGLWHTPHNSYTQVSSESGVPGLVCYLGLLLSCFSTTRGVHKAAVAADRTDVVAVSYCLWLSLVIFSISTFFSSVAYHIYLPMLAGLTVALQRSAQYEPSPASIERIESIRAAAAHVSTPRIAAARFRPSETSAGPSRR
jgi:O-antigen ligase